MKITKDELNKKPLTDKQLTFYLSMAEEEGFEISEAEQSQLTFLDLQIMKAEYQSKKQPTEAQLEAYNKIIAKNPKAKEFMKDKELNQHTASQVMSMFGAKLTDISKRFLDKKKNA